MAEMILRGLRYLAQTKNQALAEYIPQNRYKDFDQQADWYRYFVPKLDTPGRAFLGCNDRYFLLTSLLKRRDAIHPWLFDRCREVEANPDDYLDLWARDHYKSTIITFAGAIQELLCDPEITIVILSNVKPVAHKFLGQIMQELERNDYLKQVYPDVLYANPREDAPTWSLERGIVVKRASNPKQSTIEGYGLVDGQPISAHYDLRIYDDIVTDKSVTNPEMIRKTTERWELSDNLQSSKSNRRWHAGTRYHFGDTYGIILDEGRGIKPRIYPATIDGTPKGEPVFMTPAAWEKKKQTQRRTLAAQMLLNPLADNQAVFKAEWFRGFDIFPAVLNVYILVDPSKGRKRTTGNRSDRTAIAVIGIDPAGNKYLLDGYRHRMGFTERYTCIKQLYDKWSKHPGVQMVKVGYEQYGAQVDVEVIREYQEREDRYFEVEELGFPREGLHSKRDRVERLEPDMKTGRFYVPSIVWHPDFAGSTGECLWSVWSKDDAKKAETEKKTPPHALGTIVMRPLQGPTKLARWCEHAFQGHRIVRAIKRRDENGDVYDLTRAFMDETRLFPFAPHDDLVDATSRIYDMEPMRPVAYEAMSTASLEELLEGAPPDA